MGRGGSDRRETLRIAAPLSTAPLLYGPGCEALLAGTPTGVWVIPAMGTLYLAIPDEGPARLESMLEVAGSTLPEASAADALVSAEPIELTIEEVEQVGAWRSVEVHTSARQIAAVHALRIDAETVLIGHGLALDGRERETRGIEMRAGACVCRLPGCLHARVAAEASGSYAADVLPEVGQMFGRASLQAYPRSVFLDDNRTSGQVRLTLLPSEEGSAVVSGARLSYRLSFLDFKVDGHVYELRDGALVCGTRGGPAQPAVDAACAAEQALAQEMFLKWTERQASDRRIERQVSLLEQRYEDEKRRLG